MEVSGQLQATVALTPGKSTQYPLHQRLREPQNRSRRCGEEKNHLSLPGIELWPSSPWVVLMPTELSVLLCCTVPRITEQPNLQST
jgi:hypothetical protein